MPGTPRDITLRITLPAPLRLRGIPYVVFCVLLNFPKPTAALNMGNRTLAEAQRRRGQQENMNRLFFPCWTGALCGRKKGRTNVRPEGWFEGWGPGGDYRLASNGSVTSSMQARMTRRRLICSSWWASTSSRLIRPSLSASIRSNRTYARSCSAVLSSTNEM